MFQAFYVPGYNGVSLETWLTINRRHDANVSMTTENKSEKTKVYICTTMYREVRADVTGLLAVGVVWWVQAQGRCCLDSFLVHRIWWFVSNKDRRYQFRVRM